MATEHNIGSGVDRPQKPGFGKRVMEKVMDAVDPAPDAVTEEAKEEAKARRVEQERTAFDLKHKPTERDAQIDGSGARFEHDG